MRGVGGTARCVTGRLATIEEIVDWAPYEHVGRRVAVPGIGAVETSHDLEPAGGGTRLDGPLAMRDAADRRRRGRTGATRHGGGAGPAATGRGPRHRGPAGGGGDAMIPFTSTTTIARGAADIWAMATDVARHPEWMDVTELGRGDGIPRPAAAAGAVDRGRGASGEARELERLRSLLEQPPTG